MLNVKLKPIKKYKLIGESVFFYIWNLIQVKSAFRELVAYEAHLKILLVFFSIYNFN